MIQPATQPPSQYEKELFQEIRQIPLPYLPNLLKIVQLFRDSVSNQQGWLDKEKERDSSHFPQLPKQVVF